jgi:5-methylcytosine-specific restriction protein A
MPKRAPRPCGRPGCPELTDERYCAGHRPRDDRPTANARGYNYRWQKVRAHYLRAHPLCADPDNIHGAGPVAATDVDHRRPRAQGGRDTWENLQALCHSCHSRKTAREAGRGG